jgi:hypothetical protein
LKNKGIQEFRKKRTLGISGVFRNFSRISGTFLELLENLGIFRNLRASRNFLEFQEF